jgi:hypothetical protein
MACRRRRWWISIVAGPESVPRIRSPDEAMRNPALAVVSAVAHAREPDALAYAVPAAEAILLRDTDSGYLFYDLIVRALRASDADTLAARSTRERGDGFGPCSSRMDGARYPGVLGPRLARIGPAPRAAAPRIEGRCAMSRVTVRDLRTAANLCELREASDHPSTNVDPLNTLMATVMQVNVTPVSDRTKTGCQQRR